MGAVDLAGMKQIKNSFWVFQTIRKKRMKELVLVLMVVVLLPGIICPPVTVKPPSPVEENPDVKPVQEDVVCSSSLSWRLSVHQGVGVGAGIRSEVQWGDTPTM